MLDPFMPIETRGDAGHGDSQLLRQLRIERQSRHLHPVARLVRRLQRVGGAAIGLAQHPEPVKRELLAETSPLRRRHIQAACVALAKGRMPGEAQRHHRLSRGVGLRRPQRRAADQGEQQQYISDK